MKEWDPLASAVAIFEETKRQQRQTEGMLRELATTTARIEQLSRTLPETLSKEVGKAIPSAADVASALMTTNWAEANKNADIAANRYERAIRFSSRRIAGLALGCTFLGAGSMVVIGLWVLPSGETSARLKLEAEEYKSKIAAMRKHGGDAALDYCTDSKGRKRLCIQVDESVKSNRKGYRIIKGY